MKRFAPRHVAFGVLVAAGAGVALYLAAQPLKRSGQMSSCQSNLKQIGLGTMQYVRDYDEQFPIARNWADGLAPYLGVNTKPSRPNAEKSFQRLFRCPTSGTFYVYNGFYSTISASQDKNSASSPLLYEAAVGGRNASDRGQSWPKIPIHSIIQSRGNNVLFGDGHVELRANKPRFKVFPPLGRQELLDRLRYSPTPAPKPAKIKSTKIKPTKIKPTKTAKP